MAEAKRAHAVGDKVWVWEAGASGRPGRWVEGKVVGETSRSLEICVYGFRKSKIPKKEADTREGLAWSEEEMQIKSLNRQISAWASRHSYEICKRVRSFLCGRQGLGPTAQQTLDLCGLVGFDGSGLQALVAERDQLRPKALSPLEP